MDLTKTQMIRKLASSGYRCQNIYDMSKREIYYNHYKKEFNQTQQNANMFEFENSRISTIILIISVYQITHNVKILTKKLQLYHKIDLLKIVKKINIQYIDIENFESSCEAFAKL